MTTLESAARQALDALEELIDWTHPDFTETAISRAMELREALEQSSPEIEMSYRPGGLEMESKQQEPFCWVYYERGEEMFAPPDGYRPDDAQPLYFAPGMQPHPGCSTCARRGLTFEESQESYCLHCVHGDTLKSNHYLPKT